MQPEPLKKRLDMRGKANADAHVGEGVFEDQVPADDPGDKFAESGVGVGVGGTGDGNHRSQFGVAEAGEDADDGDENQGEGECGPGAGAPGHGGVSDEVVDQGGVADFRGVELLACHGGADDGEDAGADDCADSQCGKRPGAQRFFQRVFGLFRFADQLINGFAGKQLAWQGSSPRTLRRAGMQVVPMSSGKPYAEVYMMEIGRAEREGFAAGMSGMRSLRIGILTGRLPARIDPNGECRLLALRLAARCFLELLFVGTTRCGALGLRCGLLAGDTLHFFAL